MRPTAYGRDVTMFYRIKVNVVDVTFKILLIANRVLPETTLPEGDLAVATAHERDACFRNRISETALHQAQADCKVSISLGQSHDNV
jgi:hypothetical protein